VIPSASSTAARNGVNDLITAGRSNAITRAVANVSDAVCGINVIQFRETRRRSVFYDDPIFRRFFPDRSIMETVKSLGSGFFISPDGYILTNEHVVQNAAEIIVTLPDGTTRNATPVGSDHITDIALIKVEGRGYPYITFGDSETIIIGEWVIALGNPFGLVEYNSKPTVTVGVVSAVDRDFGRVGDRVYQDMIQTDAAINQGNSGGPLVNSLGELIGMNTFIYTGNDHSTGSVGIGFAIPSNRIQRVLNDLKQYGEVNRQWTTGLTVRQLTRFEARQLGVQRGFGALITRVEPASPASRAGLREDDAILDVNGQNVADENDIWNVINDEDLRGGDVLRLKVFRGQQIFEVDLKLKRIGK
jgi:serine protease Do